MERYAWKATVLPGKLDEYIKRHDNIWPEMKEVLAAAGIHNYTIWNVGNELFGYYECDSVEFAAKVQADSPVVDRWNEYMKDVNPVGKACPHIITSIPTDFIQSIQFFLFGAEAFNVVIFYCVLIKKVQN